MINYFLLLLLLLPLFTSNFLVLISSAFAYTFHFSRLILLSHQKQKKHPLVLSPSILLLSVKKNMGSSSQTCFFCHRNRQLIIPLLLFLISSLTLMKSIAEGRANNKLLLQVEEATQVEEEEKVMVRRSVMIGSRPPSCERKCNSCVHCEAVQVPVTTKAAITNKNRSAHFSSAAAAAAGISNLAYSRGDGITNYKPMSWKCKCGNFFFNP